MIDIIGVQLDLGAAKKGVNMGPAAIRFAGFPEMLYSAGIAYVDEGDLIPIMGGASLPNMKFYEAINDVNGKLFRETTDALKRGLVPVILGGDHSVAAGSIAAVSTYYKRIGVVWMDAHADFNDDKSTVTGNVHGMPLSAVCGCGPDSMISFGKPVVTVDPANVAIVGGRDIEPQEWIRLKEAGVTVFTMEDIRGQGIDAVMEKAIAIASNGTEGIHVSYDIDGVDPADAPGVGTPVPDGISAKDALRAAELLNLTGKVISMDMVEVNPILDNKGITADLACKLIIEVIKKRR